jgi:poly(A) polymerase
MLRAVRFAARLNFEIEPATFAAIRELAPKIKLISAERVRDELIKLFAPSENENAHYFPAARGLVLLRDSGLLEYILPELAATITCDQSPDFHPEGTVFNHVRLMLEKLPPDAGELLPWAVLFHDIAKPVTAQRDAETGRIHFYGHEKVGADMAEQILQRLRFPKKQTEEIVIAVENHMQFKDVKQMRKATLRRLLMRETFPLELELHRLDCLGSSGDLEHYEFLLAEAEALKHQPALRPPLLTGDDLLTLGFPRGKKIGELLHEVREKQLADELKTRDEALAWVKRVP